MATASLQIETGRLPNLPLPVTPKFVTRANSKTWMLPRIVRRYFQAWERHDTNSLDELFTPDAVYQITRSNQTRCLRGIAEIKEYWNRNGREQCCVRWKVAHQTVKTLPGRIDFPWEVEFNRLDNEVNYHYILSGRMCLHLRGDRIEKLVENYNIERRLVGPTTRGAGVASRNNESVGICNSDRGESHPQLSDRLSAASNI